ncbi:MAG: hypothetical protein EOM12_03440 [Verrucomicrobiae bacterium]|nr:hypothetical protein [Verrucomicrobiae bacterium]
MDAQKRPVFRNAQGGYFAA